MDGIDKKQNEEGLEFTADRISALPDDIISTILSFLSTREAASTSVLSPRWSNSWKHTPNLNFIDINSIGNNDKKTTEIEHNSWDAETCKHVKMVNSALESHQALFLERFKIFIYINKSAKSTVTKWLEFVGSRRVKRLELDFLCPSEKHGVELGDLRPMKYLKTMCLRSLKVSGEDISLFLRNCPLLRKLSITKASLTSDVHVSGATLALKHLQIRRRNGRDFDITISAPNLSTVFVDAGRGQLRFENVPKLVVAIFRIRTRITMNNFFSTISCLASQLQSLTLSTSRHEILRKGFPQLSKLKTLIIQDKGKQDHTSLLAATTTYVVSACPRLQKFSLVSYNVVEGRGAKICYEKCKKLVFQASCAANIIQSVAYISESEEFQKINTCTTLVNENLNQIKAQLCQQVQLQFQVQLDVQWYK